MGSTAYPPASIGFHPGPRTAALGFLLEIRPFPMLGVLAATWVAALLPGHPPRLPELVTYLFAVGAVLYSAHLRDTLVDTYTRHEGSNEPATFWDAGDRISEDGLTHALVLTIGVAIAVLVWLAVTVDLVLLIVGLSALVVALGYAGRLDNHPVTITAAYPTGVLLAMAGAYHLAAGRWDPVFVAVAVPIWLYLAGAKMLSDILDSAGDLQLGKRTCATVLGIRGARTIGYSLVILGLAVFAAGAGRLTPASMIMAPVLGTPIVLASLRVRALPAVLLLVGGAYLQLVLVGGVFIGWFRIV